MSRPPHARAKILDAAERVLMTQSAAAFTLDAVAAEAGVSKGGLIYHFASKEALLEALVTRSVASVDAALAAAARSGEPGAFTRAYLDITIPVDPAPADSTAGVNPVPGEGPVAALVAAVAMDPRLLAPLHAAYDRWQERLEDDGIGAAQATVVRLAVDGWWFAALLQLTPLRPDVHRAVRDMLESLADGS